MAFHEIQSLRLWLLPVLLELLFCALSVWLKLEDHGGSCVSKSHALFLLAWSVWWNSICLEVPYFYHCRTHNVSVCLYKAHISCGSTLLYIKTLSAAATIVNIKFCTDAKIPQFPIFGTRNICLFYSNYIVDPSECGVACGH